MSVTTVKHGAYVCTYVFSNGDPITLCRNCKEQAGITGEGEPQAGDTPCEWCGKGRLKRI